MCAYRISEFPVVLRKLTGAVATSVVTVKLTTLVGYCSKNQSEKYY